MKRRHSIAALLLALGVPPALADPAAERDEPIRVAAGWLALLDTGDLAAAWAAGAAPLRDRIDAEDWTRAVKAVRASLGALRSRGEPSATMANTLPGAPDGRYALLQYRSAFEHKAAAVETVTLQLDDAGTWRPAGYFVR